MNVIFFAGDSVDLMSGDEFRRTMRKFVVDRRLPSETVAFFMGHEPMALAPGLLLTDDFTPVHILQGQG